MNVAKLLTIMIIRSTFIEQVTILVLCMEAFFGTNLELTNQLLNNITERNSKTLVLVGGIMR